jgi:hypothetical protein
MHKNKIISIGFIAAAAMNISGVLIFSRFFTNSVIPESDPVVMSNFGLLMIVIWGFAYWSVSKDYNKVKWIVGVFAVEKFIYGFVWTKWLLNNDISLVYAKDTMAGIFYTIYGINDWTFFIFFAYVFFCFELAKNEKDFGITT